MIDYQLTNFSILAHRYFIISDFVITNLCAVVLEGVETSDKNFA